MNAEDDISPEQLEEERRKALCTKGLVNRDPDIIHLLDGRIGASSWAIPAGVTKNGGTERPVIGGGYRPDGAAFCPGENPDDPVGTEIMEGSMEARPVKKGEQNRL